jgi:hypothetical protein
LDAPVFVPLGRGRGVKKIENFHSRSEPGTAATSRAGSPWASRATRRRSRWARAGIKNVIDLAYRLGTPRDPKHPLQPYPTTAIGASEVNPLAMASTATFVNGGFRVTPRFATSAVTASRPLRRRRRTREGLRSRENHLARTAPASRGLRGDDGTLEEPG